MRKSLTALTCLLLVSDSFAKLENVGSYDNGLLQEIEKYKEVREKKMDIINKRIQTELSGLDQKSLSEMLAIQSSEVEGSKDGPVVERIKSWPIDDEKKTELIDQVKQMNEKVSKDWTSTAEIKDEAKKAEIEKKNAELLKPYAEFVLPPAPSEKFMEGLKLMPKSLELEKGKVKDANEFSELRKLDPKSHAYGVLNTFKLSEYGEKKYGIEGYKDGNTKIKLNLGNGQTRMIDFGSGHLAAQNAKVLFEVIDGVGAGYTQGFEMFMPAVNPYDKYLKADISEKTELANMVKGVDTSTQTVEPGKVIVQIPGSEEGKTEQMSLDVYIALLKDKNAYLRSKAAGADYSNRKERSDLKLEEHISRLIKITDTLKKRDDGKLKMNTRVADDIVSEAEKRIEIANKNRDYLSPEKHKAIDEAQETVKRYREAAAAAAAK